MRDSSLTSISPNLLKSTFGHGSKSKPPPNDAPAEAEEAVAPPFCITPFTKDFTSSAVMRPF